MGINRPFINDDASALDGKAKISRRLHLPTILVDGMGIRRVVPNTPPVGLPKISAGRIPDGLEITNVFDQRTWGSDRTTLGRNDPTYIEETKYRRTLPRLTDGLKITKASDLQQTRGSSIATPPKYSSVDLEEDNYAQTPVGPRHPDLKGCCRANHQQNRLAGPAWPHSIQQTNDTVELLPLAVTGVKIPTPSHQKSVKLLPKRQNSKKLGVTTASIAVRNNIRIPIFGKAVVFSKRKPPTNESVNSFV